MKKDAIYVRYVYLTEKGLKMLEALDEYLDEIAVERIHEDEGMPPAPPKRMRDAHWVKDGKLRV